MKYRTTTLESLIKKMQTNINLSKGIKEFQKNNKVYYKYSKWKNTYQFRINNSIVFARTYVDLEAPYPDSLKGKLKLNFNTSQILEPNKELWVPNLESLEIGRVIERGLRANVINLDKLVIDSERVWSISLELHCFSLDGNIIDCGFLAALESLKNAKIPFQEYQIEKQDINWINQDCFCKTLYYFDTKIIENISVYETSCSDSGICFILSDNKIIALQKLKGGEIPLPKFKEMLDIVFDQYTNYKWDLILSDNIWNNLYKTTKIFKVNEQVKN
jgi:exosome complex RNA-binding protein Rrp42 (RNase PH superfamily)